VQRMGTARGTSSRRGGPSVEKLGPSKATPQRRKKVPVEPEYVGIDLHRRRSVIVRMSPDGEPLSTMKIDNEPYYKEVLQQYPIPGVE
jgi:hypothetical protein